ncbi:MAG: AAA family ATPase [Planctomycetaceae bacterium]
MIQKSTGSNRSYRRYCRVLRRLLANVAEPKEVERLTSDQQVIARQLLDADPQERPQVFRSCLAGMGEAGSILHSDVFQVDPMNEPDPYAVSSVQDLGAVMSAVEWEWQNWLPRGHVTLLVAEAGSGKSLFAIWGVVRSVLTGERWPDGSTPEHDPSSVVFWIEAEHFHQGLLERVKLAGLPADRIKLPKIDPLDVVKFSDDAEVEELREKIREHKPRLLVIDALSGTHDARENENDAMLPIMRVFVQLAQEFNIPVLLIHHVNKSTEGGRITPKTVRGAGSILQLPRVVLALEKLDGAPDGVLQLRAIKRNIGEDQPAIGIRMGEGKLEYVAAPGNCSPQSPIERAKDFLAAKLRIMPRQRCDLVKEAEGPGIKTATLDRAKAELGLITIEHDGKKCWALPAERETYDFT